MTLFNLVRCNTSTLGTGSIVVGSAVSGYKDFSGIPNGTVVHYGLRDITSGVVLNSEVGSGTWTSATSTLSRDTVYSSTNSGNKISLATGTAEVYLTALAENFTTAAIGAEPADATIVKTGNASWIDLTDSGVTTLHSHAVNVGTGTAGQVAKWAPTGNALVDAALIPPATNVLTLTATAASTLAAAITAGKTLTLTAVDNYTLTIPATGTVGLLAVANQWTAQNQITVATTTITGLVLKTSDNNTTKNLVEIRSSTDAVLATIGATGMARFANIGLGNTSPDSRFLIYTDSAIGVGGTNPSCFVMRPTFYGNSGEAFVYYSSPYIRFNSGVSSLTHFHIESLSFSGTGFPAGIIQYGLRIKDLTQLATNYSIWTQKGLVALGDKTTITGWQDVNQLIVTGFTTQTLPPVLFIDNTAATNTVRNVLQLEVQSTGLATVGLGSGLLYTIETATSGTVQSAAQIAALWTDATNATRKADLVLSSFDTAAREGIRIRADGTRSLVGIDTAAPTARLHLPAGGTAANTAPLKFTTQASPLTTVEQGTMELVGNSLQFSQLVKRRGVMMSQTVRTADFQLISSNAESAAITTAEHGAGYLEVGKCEEIVCWGTLQKDVGAPTNTLTIRVKYAGATIHTIVSSNAAIAANSVIEIRIVATCRTTGATGTLQINSIVRIDGDIITPAAPTSVTVNTTTAENTTVTAQFTNSSATNNLVIHQSHVKCIEPNR